MKRTIKMLLRRFGYDVVEYKPVFEGALKRCAIDTVIDVGANTGQFATEIHGLLPAAKHIYSFEPLHDVYLEMEKRCSGIPGFKGFNIGLGEKNGTISIKRSKYSPSSSFLPMGSLHKKRYPKTAETFDEQVEMKRLDDVAPGLDLSGNVLLKMDVQGFEGAVIKGGPATVSKAKVLLLETSFVELYEGQPLFDDIYRLLRPLGFKYIGRFAQHWDNKADEVMYEDSVFVKA
jgi:FkbM family methyltransferase